MEWENSLYQEYRTACEALQRGISEAKEASWHDWLESLDQDPWGKPYKTVRAKLRPWAPPVTSSLEPQFVENIVGSLFPHRERFEPPPMSGHVDPSEGRDEDISPVTEEELRVAVRKMKSKKTAPGLDGVPGRALVVALTEMDEWARKLFTLCLARGVFPQSWKTGKLILLRKEGRPPEDPSAYRPIVLLSEMSKLFERVLAARLAQSMSPGLHDTQFGFRHGRSTIDAIERVRELADEAVSQGEVLLAVSLDISNAFNTLPWETVKAALNFHSVPRYLRDVVEAYFAGRAVRFPLKNGTWSTKMMSCGVPQGSVLGPLLWNIGYDYVLRGALLQGVSVTCYADDTLVTARGTSFREAAILGTAGVAQVVRRIGSLGLTVALHKSEAMLFHGPRRGPPTGAEIIVGGTSIGIGSWIKYLGLIIDSRWTFKEHFSRLAPRLMAAAGALGRLLPNVGGPSVTCRKLYTGVLRSMALYGAPIWAGTLGPSTLVLLRRPQRTMALRVVRAYRTVSFEGACVLAGVPPWDLEAEALAAVHRRRALARVEDGGDPPQMVVTQWRREAHEEVLQTWEERLANPGASRELVAAMRPILRDWLSRDVGALTFRLTQVLTGHGCFGRYLCQVVRREPSPICHHCGDGVEDSADHTRRVCSAWEERRAALFAVIGRDLSLPTVLKAMVGSEQAWQAVEAFAESVISAKEAAERAREADPEAPQERRRRLGRRRRAFIAAMPP